MIQIDIPMATCSALMFVDAARRQLQAERDPDGHNFYQTLAKINIFCGFFFVWIPVYFVLQYFPWETTYLYSYAEMSAFMKAAFVPFVILGVFAAANLGVFVGWRWVRQGRIRHVRLLYLAIWLYSSLWIVGWFPRAATISPNGTQFHNVDVGTFQEYKELRDSDGRPVLFYVLPFLRETFDVDQEHHTDAERSDSFFWFLPFTLAWWGIPQILMMRHLSRYGRRMELGEQALTAARSSGG
jgi:hypothetical protein